MALPVGVQLYSIRDSVEADMHAALAQVKELGYDGVEFAGLYGNKPADIRAWCAERKSHASAKSRRIWG